jgi:hypothetical protein
LIWIVASLRFERNQAHLCMWKPRGSEEEGEGRGRQEQHKFPCSQSWATKQRLHLHLTPVQLLIFLLLFSTIQFHNIHIPCLSPCCAVGCAAVLWAVLLCS